MKKIIKILCTCIILSVFVTGCSNANNKNNNTEETRPNGISTQKSDMDDIRRNLFQKGDQDMQADTESLKEKYPQYFDLDITKGIEIYVWGLNETYYCGALSGTNRNKTYEELSDLREHGATLDEMKAILSTYDIADEDISIISLETLPEHTPKY